jgi:hypothetical protein
MLGATKARLELETDKRLSIEDFDHTHRFIGTTPLQPDRWYRLRWYAATGLETTTRVWVDDALDLEVNNATMSTENTRVLHVGRSSESGGAHEFYYDDLVISTGGFVADGASVRLMRPDGAGAFTGWSGSFADVTQWPHDGDATLCASPGVGAAMTHAIQSAAAAGITGEVLAVKSMAVMARLGATASASSVRVRIGATNFDNAHADGNTIWRLRTWLHQVNPQTTQCWLLPELESLEIGAVQTVVGGAQRMSAVGAQVLFAPH